MERSSAVPVRHLVRVAGRLLRRGVVLPVSAPLALRVQVREKERKRTRRQVSEMLEHSEWRSRVSIFLENSTSTSKTKKNSSHSHGRLLAPLRAARLATFALFSLFVFVPWVLLRVPLSVARAQACAPLADSGGRGIPRSTVIECLRLIKIDDVVFWVSVGLTAGALIAAGLLRFSVRRRLGIEGGSCCGGGGGRRNAATTKDAKGGGGQGGSSSSFSRLLAAGSWLLADVLTWLLCPACALCQEARTAAAWEREKKREAAAGADGGGERGGGGDEEEALLLLEAPAVPLAFDRGGEGGV